ncbi:MAG: PAS domain S-box protein, partial [Cyanobacteria bacterium]|nr:PAS domain S-box protein [Cyanobacteriota bacterium]
MDYLSGSNPIPRTYDELSELVKKQAGAIERLNNALVATQRRIRTILTSFPLGLIVVNDQNEVEAVNKQVNDIFGYLPEELVGHPINYLFPEVKSVEVNPKPVRVTAKRKSSELFPVEIFVNDFEAGGNRRIFIHLQDITERHRLEQLRQDLIAMVSHDLRTPLTSVRGVLTMVDEGVYGDLKPSGHKAIERAQQSTDYLISLVKDLLDAEKIESGTLEVTFSETTVGKVVQKAVHASHSAGKENNVEVETDFTNDVFMADEDRIM